MYEAIVLMPIRASVLRRPASNAVSRLSTAASGVRSSDAAGAGRLDRQLDREPRHDRRGAGGERHRERVDVEDVGRVDEDVGPAAEAGVGERGVDGAGGEDRRDRQSRAGERAVRQDDELRARAGGGDRGLGESIEGRREAVWSFAGRPGRFQPADPARERVEERVAVGDDRAVQADRPRAAADARRAAEQRRPPAEVDPQVHDGLLALRVDRRVRDLGERLAEVVGDRPVDAAQGRGRRVVAHRPERLVGLDDHRLDVEAGLLGVEPGEVAERRRRGGPWRRGRRRPVDVGRPGRVVDRQAAEQVGLRVGVLEDRARAAGRRGASRPGPAARGGPCRTRPGGSPRPPTRRRRAGPTSPRRPPAGARCGRGSPRPGGRRRRRSRPGRPTGRAARRSPAGAWPRAGAARGGATTPRASRPAAPSPGPSRSRRAARSSRRATASRSPPARGAAPPRRGRGPRPPPAPRRRRRSGPGPARGCRGPCRSRRCGRSSGTAGRGARSAGCSSRSAGGTGRG